MGAIDLDFARGIALVLQGENIKASVFVKHGPSLGMIRERIVQRFVRDETPERFRVETGLIHSSRSTSRQCDLLVHEPNLHAPLYRLDEFVVVSSGAARAVVEVKTMLDKKRFREVVNVHNSVMAIQLGSNGRVRIPTFGYALDGVNFESFLEYIQSAATENLLENEISKAPSHMNCPVCVAVHNKQYIGIRPLQFVGSGTRYFIAVNFASSSESTDKYIQGIETGLFLQLYQLVLQNYNDVAMADLNLNEWTASLKIPDRHKVWITSDGTIHRGRPPQQ